MVLTFMVFSRERQSFWVVCLVSQIASMLGTASTAESKSVLASPLDEEDNDKNHDDEQTHNCNQTEIESQIGI